MLTRVFAYGTLEIPVIMERVTGRCLPHTAAVLRGYARFLLAGECYPAVVAHPRGSVNGLLFEDADQLVLDRLDSYEGEQYLRKALLVEVSGRRVDAWVYVLKDGYLDRLSALPWDRKVFEAQHYSRFLASLDP